MAKLAYGCLLALLCACSSSSSSSGDTQRQQQGVTIPACSVPAGANSFSDASATGCQPQSIFQICQVPNGSVIYPDGAVASPDGAPAQCTDACSDTEYVLSCFGSVEGGATPVPGSSLGCKVITIPTPANETQYCCPCGQ
jgi:hypothetical protein